MPQVMPRCCLCRSGLLTWDFRVLEMRQPHQGGSSYQEAPVPSLLISRALTPSLWTFEDIEESFEKHALWLL